MNGTPEHGKPYYGPARIAAALMLVGLAAVLLVLDALRADYAVDSAQLGLILGTGSVLLAVEAGNRILGGK